MLQYPHNKKGYFMIAKCSVCGVEFERPAAWLKKVKEPMCSRRCNGIRRSEHLKQFSGNMKGKQGKQMFGEENPCWRGGRYKEPQKGYVMVRNPKHPRARKNGYVLEHILVAESMLGRPLKDGEEIHHKNRDRADNRPENLEIFESHMLHWMQEHYETVQNARDLAYINAVK